MININKIRELYIASRPFDFLDRNDLEYLNYNKWKAYLDNSFFFIWYEDTEVGKKVLRNIEEIPFDFRENVLSDFDNTRCYADFNKKKNIYNICVIFHKELKRIVVSFNRKVQVEDLRLCLDMAKHLDALLLYNGKTIIDEKIIESLE